MYYAEVSTKALFEARVDNTSVSDLISADDALMFVESLEVQVKALEALYVRAKPLGLTACWTKSKVQLFGC